MMMMMMKMVVDGDGSDSDNVKRNSETTLTKESKQASNKQFTKWEKLKCHVTFQVKNVKVFASRIQPYHFASTNWELWKVKWDDRKHEFFIFLYTRTHENV